ncbi:metal ABC transporter permease [Candidatus Contubernalis alkalaceticus]|uniref:metal ABC transporter permease n=1 Tax=Candidatus Contubernalis alkaliaceticus TaxID=338645 RepID=UPI0029623E58|nr:metal ABC transporter permease [Candidatus Contubernalis alkalaceticus]
MDSLHFFIDSLMNYSYLQNAMAGGIMVGTICGFIGCFIILRGMALMGDAISHAVLPGVAAAYIFGFSIFIGAVITGVLTSIAIGYITQNSKLKDDTAIGLMFTSAFALGVILITLQRGTGVDLWHILFGNVLAVSREDLMLILIIGLLVVGCIFLFYKQILLSTFDPIMARAVGVPTNIIHYLMMLLLSLVTVASLKTVGIVLVVAMFIAPGATAYLLTERLPSMLALSAVFGIVSAVTGVYLSFIFDVATGASIVMVASLLFALSFFLSPKQGLLVQKYRVWRAGV